MKKPVLYTIIGTVSAVVWFYIFWIPIKTDFLDSYSLKARHFNPFHKAPQPVYLINPDPLSEVVVSAKYLEPIEIPVENIEPLPENPYHLIVGSFTMQENAVRLKEVLWTQGNNDAQILQTNFGYSRVSIKSFATYKKAYMAWDQTRNGEYHDAWLLKVK